LFSAASSTVSAISGSMTVPGTRTTPKLASASVIGAKVNAVAIHATCTSAARIRRRVPATVRACQTAGSSAIKRAGSPAEDARRLAKSCRVGLDFGADANVRSLPARAARRAWPHDRCDASMPAKSVEPHVDHDSRPLKATMPTSASRA
jgi:hypothetical protein